MGDGNDAAGEAGFGWTWAVEVKWWRLGFALWVGRWVVG
jgi:hypothetical protein